MKDEINLNIAIIGAGGVGGYFGAKLSKAGHNVTFVARDKHLNAIKENGLQVNSINGSFHLNKVEATDTISALKNQDLILVTTKAEQVKDVASQIARIVNNETVVIPLQNGVMATQELVEYIPNEQIIPGLCQIISTIEAPGVINHFGVDPKITIGEQNNLVSERILHIQQAFKNAGITTEVSDDIEKALWKKFILINVGGLIAVCRSTYGAVREIPESRNLMEKVIEEGLEVAEIIGIVIESDYKNKMMAFIDSFPYEATSSLCRDIWSGKPSEIHYKNGALVTLGKKYKIKTPVNEFIYHCLLPLERKARN